MHAIQLEHELQNEVRKICRVVENNEPVSFASNFPLGNFFLNQSNTFYSFLFKIHENSKIVVY